MGQRRVRCADHVPDGKRAHDLLRGATRMVAASLVFALMALGVQVASEGLPNTMVVFFRNLLALLFVAPFALRGGFVSLRTGRFRDHFVRTVAGLGSMYCFFYGIGHLRLADAISLHYTLPLFIPLVEATWLKQPMSRRLWAPLVLGFAGVVLVLRPGWGVFQLASLAALTAGFLSAVAQTGVRRLTATEPASRIILYFSAMSSLASAPPAAVQWTSPSPALWLALLLTGILALLGQYLMTWAYAAAPASQVGAFIYAGVPFAMLVDWLRRGILPDGFTLMGTVLICGAGVAMLRLAGPRAPRPRGIV